VVSAGLLVEPAPAWANERVAPSSVANAIVSSFFIQSPQRYQFWNHSILERIVVQHFKQRSWKNKAACFKAAFQ
jgi:hypothetical protein